MSCVLKYYVLYVISETFPGYSLSPYSPQSYTHRRAKANATNESEIYTLIALLADEE